MKINLILGAAISSAALLTSCGLDSTTDERTYSDTLSQLIIPDDVTKDVTFNNKVTYSFKQDLTANTMTLTTSNFSINGVGGLLTSGAMPTTYNMSTASYIFKDGKGTFGTSEATGINGYMTGNTTVGTSQGSLGFVVSFHANGATVKSFYPDVVFLGSTTTHYVMGEAGDREATTKDAFYRVTFDEKMEKAVVIIYNIKFAPEMPKALEAVILKNLDVTLGRDGYTITGTDIIPEVKEGTGTTPYENYPFRSFSLKTINNELTKVACDFTVSVKMGPTSMDFTGEFKGDYASATGDVE